MKHAPFRILSVLVVACLTANELQAGSALSTFQVAHGPAKISVPARLGEDALTANLLSDSRVDRFHALGAPTWGALLVHPDTYEAGVVRYGPGGTRALRHWKIAMWLARVTRLSIFSRWRHKLVRQAGYDPNEPINPQLRVMLREKIQLEFAPEFEKWHFGTRARAVAYALAHGDDAHTESRVARAEAFIARTRKNVRADFRRGFVLGLRVDAGMLVLLIALGWRYGFGGFRSLGVLVIILIVLVAGPLGTAFIEADRRRQDAIVPIHRADTREHIGHRIVLYWSEIKRALVGVRLQDLLDRMAHHDLRLAVSNSPMDVLTDIRLELFGQSEEVDAGDSQFVLDEIRMRNFERDIANQRADPRPRDSFPGFSEALRAMDANRLSVLYSDLAKHWFSEVPSIEELLMRWRSRPKTLRMDLNRMFAWNDLYQDPLSPAKVFLEPAQLWVAVLSEVIARHGIGQIYPQGTIHIWNDQTGDLEEISLSETVRKMAVRDLSFKGSQDFIVHGEALSNFSPHQIEAKYRHLAQFWSSGTPSLRKLLERWSDNPDALGRDLDRAFAVEANLRDSDIPYIDGKEVESLHQWQALLCEIVARRRAELFYPKDTIRKWDIENQRSVDVSLGDVLDKMASRELSLPTTLDFSSFSRALHDLQPCLLTDLYAKLSPFWYPGFPTILPLLRRWQNDPDALADDLNHLFRMEAELRDPTNPSFLLPSFELWQALIGEMVARWRVDLFGSAAILTKESSGATFVESRVLLVQA